MGLLTRFWGVSDQPLPRIVRRHREDAESLPVVQAEVMREFLSRRFEIQDIALIRKRPNARRAGLARTAGTRSR